MTLPINTSMASVPASIKSSFVTTASVLLPKQKRHLSSNEHGDKECKTHDYKNGNKAKETKTRRVFTIRVDFTGHLESLRGCHVCVGSSHSQDDRVGVGDEFYNQLPDLNFYVFGLISHRYLFKNRLIIIRTAPGSPCINK